MPEPCRLECGDWEKYWEGEPLGGEDWEKSRPHIDYQQVKFSDGLVLTVPYEINGKVHRCPTITACGFWPPAQPDDPVQPPENHFENLQNFWDDLCSEFGDGLAFDDSLPLFSSEERASLRRTLVSNLSTYFIIDEELYIPPLLKIRSIPMD